MKLVYLVLDGVADRLSDTSTSLSMAKKPYLDLLARAGACGAVYTVGKGVAPESDAAVMSILGYD
ncbi:MAG: phosphonopyruvate decarboxylase, partial [Zestosphaera sp.]